MLPNNYAGRCLVCGVQVPPGEGYVERSDRLVGESARLAAGRWSTLCASGHCHTHALGRAPAPAVRQLTADGRVVMPFDRDALPVIKAMPGARWDADRKVWTVSLHPTHRPDVLARARQLGLEIDPSLLVVAEDPRVAALLDRPQLVGLYAYQRDGVEWMARRERLLCADEMGLGKTRVALSALDWSAPVLIVCPASVKGSWSDEIAKWGVPMRVTILAGRKSFRWPEPGEAVIVNWDILPAEITEPPAGLQVIADEVHAASNPKALRTKRFREIAKRATGRVIGLTGTPIDKSPMQLWSVLAAIGCNPWSWTAFTRAFNGYKRVVARGVEVQDWRRDDRGAIVVEPGTLERLETVMIRRTKEQVAPDMPPVVVTEIPVECGAELSTAMDAIGSEWGDLLASDELPPLQVFSQVRRALAESRIPAMLERVAEYESTETPLLVFSAHRAPIEALAGREGWAVIHGDVSPDVRSQVVRDFQAGLLRGVGLTITAGGVGLTLTHASHALFVDQSWAPRDNAQARARLHRIGQAAASVTIEIMTSEHIVDRHVGTLLWGKEELVRRTLAERYEYQAPDATAPAGTDESHDEWAARVAAVNADRDAAEARVRARALAKMARQGLTPEQAAERAGSIVRDRSLPACPADAVERVQAAWAALLSVCDGALADDGQGFDAGDAAMARWISGAVAAGDPSALAVAWSRLPKYKGQIGSMRA